MIASGRISSMSLAITSRSSLRGSSRLFLAVREQNPWQGGASGQERDVFATGDP